MIAIYVFFLWTAIQFLGILEIERALCKQEEPAHVNSCPSLFLWYVATCLTCSVHQETSRWSRVLRSLARPRSRLQALCTRRPQVKLGSLRFTWLTWRFWLRRGWSRPARRWRRRSGWWRTDWRRAAVPTGKWDVVWMPHVIVHVLVEVSSKFLWNHNHNWTHKTGNGDYWQDF